MSQSIRYQVFVSSTFTDLKEERAEVLQAIWELDCIPTGMEAFLATNEAQWEVIQKVIDECDYYVLIIGGRYGSVTPEGVSYTEKEYNYAKRLSIPVLGFVHGDPENIPVSKAEKDEGARVRLEAFRARVMAEHPIRKWTNAQELGGLVSRSISRAIKVNPRPGWIRNVGPSNLELLEQINLLTRENADLKEKIKVEPDIFVNAEELACGMDQTELSGSVRLYEENQPYFSATTSEWKAIVSWDGIFRIIGPILMNEATEIDIKSALSDFVGLDENIDFDHMKIRDQTLYSTSLAKVIVQLRALGLVDKGVRKRAVSDRGRYWRLTEKGERYLVGLLARKKDVKLGLRMKVGLCPRMNPIGNHRKRARCSVKVD